MRDFLAVDLELVQTKWNTKFRSEIPTRKTGSGLGGGGVLQEFLGGDVPLGPRNPLTYTRAKVNSAKPPYPRVTVSPVQIKSSTSWSVSWKMTPYSRPKRSDLCSKLLENHTLHSGILLYCPYMAVPPGKPAHLFRFSTFSGNFPVGRTDETCSIYCRNEIPANRARKVSGTRGRNRGDKRKHKGTQGTEETQVDTAWIRKTGQSL